MADDGVFRPTVPVPEIDRVGRRGMHLMFATMDEVHIREGTSSDPGTVVTLVKHKSSCREAGAVGARTRISPA